MDTGVVLPTSLGFLRLCFSEHRIKLIPALPLPSRRAHPRAAAAEGSRHPASSRPGPFLHCHRQPAAGVFFFFVFRL